MKHMKLFKQLRIANQLYGWNLPTDMTTLWLATLITDIRDTTGQLPQDCKHEKIIVFLKPGKPADGAVLLYVSEESS